MSRLLPASGLVHNYNSVYYTKIRSNYYLIFINHIIMASRLLPIHLRKHES